MSLAVPACAIVNQGSGSWAFEEHAHQLARALWMDVTLSPRDFNYLLGWELPVLPPSENLFIPHESIKIASDKRLQAGLFIKHRLVTPETHLLDTPGEVQNLLSRTPAKAWALKYPISCGASGHQFLNRDTAIPINWPKPYIVQEFIRMDQPEVYRIYGVAGTLFGWNARRFPAGTKPSPWVAHARGARYVHFEQAPAAAEDQARAALTITGLINSFGCVDLIQRNDEWLVLEIGTDGVVNHVDRDVDNPNFVEEIDRRIAEAFWDRFNHKPWGAYGWKRRQTGQP